MLIDLVGLAGLDDGVDGGAAFPTDLRSGERPVAAANGNAADRAFGDIVVCL